MFSNFRDNTNIETPVIPRAFYKLLVWCENNGVQSEAIIMNNIYNVSIC